MFAFSCTLELKNTIILSFYIYGIYKYTYKIKKLNILM